MQSLRTRKESTPFKDWVRRISLTTSIVLGTVLPAHRSGSGTMTVTERTKKKRKRTFVRPSFSRHSLVLSMSKALRLNKLCDSLGELLERRLDILLLLNESLEVLADSDLDVFCGKGDEFALVEFGVVVLVEFLYDCCHVVFIDLLCALVLEKVSDDSLLNDLHRSFQLLCVNRSGVISIRLLETVFCQLRPLRKPGEDFEHSCNGQDVLVGVHGRNLDARQVRHRRGGRDAGGIRDLRHSWGLRGGGSLGS
mmetsp:Transcript_36236/g.71289  ORF Transcript_36236/g.71289 Transcript_36236/m.71289 type:complete len:252 (-) Transcript_36236:158-913(-)